MDNGRVAPVVRVVQVIVHGSDLHGLLEHIVVVIEGQRSLVQLQGVRVAVQCEMDRHCPAGRVLDADGVVAGGAGFAHCDRILGKDQFQLVDVDPRGLRGGVAVLVGGAKGRDIDVVLVVVLRVVVFQRRQGQHAGVGIDAEDGPVQSFHRPGHRADAAGCDGNGGQRKGLALHGMAVVNRGNGQIGLVVVADGDQGQASRGGVNHIAMVLQRKRGVAEVGRARGDGDSEVLVALVNRVVGGGNPNGDAREMPPDVAALVIAAIFLILRRQWLVVVHWRCRRARLRRRFRPQNADMFIGLVRERADHLELHLGLLAFVHHDVGNQEFRRAVIAVFNGDSSHAAARVDVDVI